MASSEMMQFTNVMAHFFAIKTWQQLRSTMISSDLALALWLCFFIFLTFGALDKLGKLDPNKNTDTR